MEMVASLTSDDSDGVTNIFDAYDSDDDFLIDGVFTIYTFVKS